MSLFGKPPNEIVESDLDSLVQDQVRERQTLEFKRDFYLRNDEGTREMLRDISAMANSYGDDIIVGVDTVGDGIASNIVGVADGELEAQRISSSCLSNIEERIGGLVVWPVPIVKGNHVILIRMAQSLRAPHMINFKGLNQFWIRHDRQKSPMSVHEIREACLRVEMLSTRVREFLEKRVADVSNFSNGHPIMTVSLTPLLIANEVIDTNSRPLREMIRDCPLNNGYLPRPCITGLEVRREADWLLRLDRNGHLDFWLDLARAIDHSPPGTGRSFTILSPWSVKEAVDGLCKLAKQIHDLCAIREPLVVKLDLWNVKDVHVRERRSGFRGLGIWPSDNLNLPPLEIDSLDDPTQTAQVILKRLGEAFGFDHSPFY